MIISYLLFLLSYNDNNAVKRLVLEEIKVNNVVVVVVVVVVIVVVVFHC